MAMSSLAGGEIDPDVTCSVCREVYTLPRLLPCFHTFCLTCIEGLATTHGLQFPCPQCHTTTLLPPSGPCGFQVNFYIKEEDLELARKGARRTICPVHSKDKERLVLFCKECDLPLCTLCKLTQHEGHSTEDLSTAAAKCAQRLTAFRNKLDTTIQQLEMKSQQTQDDLQSVNRRETALRIQVKYKRYLLLTRLDRTVEVVMRDLESTSREAQQRVTAEAGSINTDLEFTTQLGRQVDTALAGTDADKLSTEKSLCQHEAKIEETRKMAEATVPRDTYRPVLDSEVDISDATLLKFIGKPRTTDVGLPAPREEITPIVPILSKEPCRRIHALAQHGSTLYVNQGGLPPHYSSGFKHTLRESGGVYRVEKVQESDKVSFKEDQDSSFFTYAKAASMYAAHFYNHSTKECLFYDMTDRKYFYRYLTMKTDTVVAFDAVASFGKFALIEAAQAPDAAQAPEGKEARVVRLYNPDHRDGPVSEYVPPDASFYPTDLCFLHNEAENTLLIADWQGDCIHLVDTADNQLQFRRYLAAGEDHLVRPTALNVDDLGRVWIGCDSGWVLRCDKVFAERVKNTPARGEATRGRLPRAVPASSSQGSSSSDSSVVGTPQSSVSSTRRRHAAVDKADRGGSKPRHKPY